MDKTLMDAVDDVASMDSVMDALRDSVVLM